MTRVGHRLAFLLALACATPLFAQTADNDRIRQLETKLDELIRQTTELRQELDQLKGAAAPPAEDLTQIDVATPPAATTTTTEPAPSALTDVQPVENVQQPGASKVFNPDIAVIGNVVGHAGEANPFEDRSPLELSEAEVSFEAFVDPFAKAKFFVSVGPEGAEVEEGFIQFITLPAGLTAKVGKTKATFGKANTWHTHVRPWVDQPLVVERFFGEEGLADTGVSVSKAIDNPWNVFLEATGEVYSGGAEGVFERVNQNDLFYNAHLKAFRDLTENSNLEVGTSWARGTAAEDPGHSSFTGVDVTYRWKPLQQGLYRGFIGRFEGIANRRDSLDDTQFGFYASGDLQVARRWFAGVRLDQVDRDSATDRGASLVLTFWPSEFSQLRGQLRRTRYAGAGDVNELLFGVQFSIGAHGAHTF